PVARQAHNLKVAGSNPAPATKSTKHHMQAPQRALFAFAAQRVGRSAGAVPVDFHCFTFWMTSKIAKSNIRIALT
ncbi:hypothetical protein, partial [Alloyangia pacifica]|uniref:hypothetical protein n=1 Tax=Alloyangia pacifica TaxID=311180 RepID=UPI001CFEEF62